MIYVITAVHNRYKITEEFIERLNKQTIKEKIHLILVDDGSTDGTGDMVKKNFPQSSVLHGDGNLWWGGSLHMAYKYLMKLDTDDNDTVMTVNDDVKMTEDFIENGVSVLDKNPNDLITACGYGMYSGELRDCAFFYDVKTGDIKRLNATDVGNCATTRSLFMKMKTVKHVGGFHPILLPHYSSDHEYTLRAYKKGHKVLCFEDLRYDYDETATGEDNAVKLTLKKLFFKGSRYNLIQKISFMFMVTPLKYIPKNIMNELKRFKR